MDNSYIENKLLYGNSKIIKKSGDLLTSINDKKKYKTFTLDNKLKVLLIENPNITKSSACMSVNVGHLDNYDDALGIAHFLEHMLFLGSTKYPGEKEYSDFIMQNGGSSNAHTSIDRTWYHYDINSDAFEKSLDIFAQFFIDPLLQDEFVEKEVKAVDSEHVKNISQDDWRIYDIIKKCFNQNHKISKFSTGNLKTLLPKNDKENIKILRDKLYKFFNEKYSANKMSLFIYHNKISDNFVDEIKDIFNKVTNNADTNSRDLSIPLVITKKDSYQEILVNPISDIKKLNIFWKINFDKNRKGENLFITDLTIDYFSHIMGHEGKNTLFEFLKKKSYITSLSAYDTYKVDNDIFIGIDLSLTNKGLEQMDNITSIIINYFRYLISDINNKKTYYKELLNEFLIKRKLDLKKNQEISPHDFVQSCASIDESYEIDFKYLLINNIIIHENFDLILEKFNSILKLINYEEMIVIKVFPKKDDIKYEKEEYYETEYLIQYKNLNNFNALEKFENYPLVSNLITLDLLDVEIIKENIPKPIKIHDIHEIYLDTRNTFDEDNIYINLSVDLSFLYNPKDIKLYLYTFIYLNYLSIFYSSEIYDYSSGLCNYSSIISDYKLYININSYYNNLIDKNLLHVFNCWLFTTNIEDIDIVNVIIEKIDKYLENTKYYPPYKKLDIIINEKLKNICSFSRNELHVEVENFKNNLKKNSKIFLKKVSKKIRYILTTGKIGGLISGNINRELSKNILQKLAILNFKTDDNINYKCMPNLSSDILYIEDSENKKDDNSAIRVLYYIDTIEKEITENWEEKICLWYLLETFIHNEVFYKLRTLENLGYIVSAFSSDLNKTFINKLYITILVQSFKLNTIELNNKIIDTINNYIYEKVNTITDNDFKSSIKGLLSILEEPDNNIYEQMSRLESYISSKNPKLDVIFDEKEKIISFLKTNIITKKKFQDFYKEKFITNPLKISIGIQSRNKKLSVKK